VKIKKIVELGLLAIAIFLISGCSSGPKPLYNYGKYSESYYGVKKDATTESALQYQKALEYCIEEVGDSRSGKVPPGMYANLGYLYLKAGQNAKAKENFIKEKTIYPEAIHFMDRMIQKIDALEGDDEK